MTLYVGTSGWAYREWKGIFYPDDLPQKRYLEYYGSVLSACEINATFYRRQEPTTFDRWAAATPESFRFATKAHRGLTHSRVAPASEDQVSFFNDFLNGVGRLGPKLGAVLFQFPPSRKKDEGWLEELLGVLKDRVPFALEFRDESWEESAIADLVAGAGGTVCLGHVEGPAPDKLAPGPLAYVRMREERYEPDQRKAWADLLAREAATRPVFAFTKHEGSPVVDPYGGVGLAQWLVETLS
jgi:uncharacterized protein YecE (DUF72 family)